MGMSAAEFDRRIANIVQLGRVVSIDTGGQKARVQIGDIETMDIPVCQYTSGQIKFHWMPSPGEQVVVFAPDGDLARAIIQGSVPKSGHAVAPDAGTPTIDLGGGTLSIIGNLKIEGDVEIIGDVTVTEDVTASGVSLVTHTHGGVVPGGGNTGEPN